MVKMMERGRNSSQQNDGNKDGTFGIKALLSAMDEATFSDSLLDDMLSTYKAVLAETGDAEIEQAYQSATEQLPKVLNDQQREMLTELELLYRMESKIALRISFSRGLYACFQHCFVKKNACTFEGLVLNQMLTVPEMERFPDYAQTRAEANALALKLGTTLDPFSREHLTSVEYCWDERSFGMLRYGYRLGYCAAQSIIMDIDPSQQPRLVEQGWRIAGELGLFMTPP